MPEIIIKNLSVTYKAKKKHEEVHALSGLDMRLENGKINVILGYNGCGKSTLLKAIAGIVGYTGDIFFDGVDAYKLAPKQRDIALVTENYLLNPMLTVFDNIALALKIYRLPREQVLSAIYGITERLGIAHTLNCKPRQLSLGQQQRVAIAKAMVKKPSVCLFDEALTALDLKLRNELRLFIKDELKKNGTTSVYVTHDLNEATSFGDKIFVLAESKVRLEGTPTQIIASGDELIEDMRKLSLLKGEGGGTEDGDVG